MSLIKTIQKQIHSVYDIRVEECAEDFLIDKNQLFSLLPAQQCTAPIPKELFLVNPEPENDTVEVALFLDESLTQNLANHSPFENLGSHNLSDFCTAIEGVSHFVYYLHKSFLAHAITQLELELQAEVDKFLLLALRAKDTPAQTQALMEILFENYSLHQNLNDQQVERYETANHLARKYCHHLSRFLKKSDFSSLLSQARQFYSLSQEEKIRCILQ